MNTMIKAICLGSLLSTSPAMAAETDWNGVAMALGRSGTSMAGRVYRVGLARTDLHVVLDGVELKPNLALGSWLAFEGEGSSTMVMGDLVLSEDEVSPVMAKLVASGIEITALHNHLLRSKPSTLYMHVLGHGDPVKLAGVLHVALTFSKTPLGGSTPAPPAASVKPIDLDMAVIDRTLGAKGKVVGGVYQVGLPRAEAINFQPTGNGKASITGDFVLTAGEVNPVLRVLRENAIEVTAIHNHMLNDEPRLFFMHFWANDDAGNLAHGLKAALDKINLAKS